MKMKITSLMLLSLLMLSATCIIPVHSSTPDSMRIEPPVANFSTNTTPVGTKFNVTVWLNMATATNFWQFYMTYNKAQLNATNSGYTGNGKSQWAGTNPTDNPAPSIGAHNATHDYVLWGEVLKSSAEKTGEGSLVWVEFQIMQAPPSGQTLTSDIGLGIDGVFNSAVYDKTFNPISVTFGKTTYSYGSVWEPPPPAKLYIDPSAVLNRSLTPSNNFTIYVKIDKATNVAFFDFKLTFNSSVVKAWNAVLGDFFPTSSTFKVEVNNASGYVRVNATLNPSELPKNGSGVLAAIVFHVEIIGSTVLHLTDIQLQDNQAHILPNESADGSFNNEDQYTLTVTVIGSGSVGKSPNNATYTWGTNVTLTATAGVGWTFAGWSVDASGSVNPTIVNMTGNKAVTATFTQALPGDVNGDGKVDITDVAIVVAAFGSYDGQPPQNHQRWDSRADTNHDGRVDILDIATVHQSYGLFG